MALKASLACLSHIAFNAPPRSVSGSGVLTAPPLVYADAYFKYGDKFYAPTDHDGIPFKWCPQKAPDLINGFGAVIIPADRSARPVCFAGRVPPWVLSRFAHRRQYIFFLEAIAQCLPLFIFWPLLQSPYFSFVDNTAAQFALAKGYSSDDAVNALASLYWAGAALKGSSPWFERVSSSANLSDKISRHDFTLADKLNWRRVNINYEQFWQVLIEAVDAKAFAAPAHAAALIAAFDAQRAGWVL